MSEGARAEEGAAWHALPIALPGPGESAECEVAGVPLLVCNVEDEIHVVHNQCPHVQVPLGGGKLRGAVFECPLHGGELDVRDGSPVAKPIRSAVACFATRETDGGAIEVQVKAP